MTINLSSQLILSASTAAEQGVDNWNNLIGIGGIIATIIVGIISCLVTWKLTKLSIKQIKLTYSTKTLNILSNSIQHQQGAINDLTVTYNNKELKNPCLLLLEIENVGNEAVINPPICIRVSENAEILPGYFKDVPNGYETKWTMKSSTNKSCNICLEHINPKQTVKACFFLDDLPNNVIFECPMQDIVIQEKGDRINEQQPNLKGRFGRLEKSTCALIILTVIIFISADMWLELLHTLNWYYTLPAPIICIALFVFSTLILSILLNVFGIKKLDNYVSINKKTKMLIVSILFVLSTILTIAILFNIVITNFILQTIIAIFVVIMLSISIHILSVDIIK